VIVLPHYFQFSELCEKQPGGKDLWLRFGYGAAVAGRRWRSRIKLL
jgi:hypothetical protein